jgi:apolipoprotein N-acyltransferase
VKASLLLAAAAAGLAGAIAPLGWAPVEWWPLALGAYGVLFGLVRRTDSAWRAALLGTVFGVALHLGGHGWIASALHRHAGLGAASAALSTLVVALYLALFIAVPCGLVRALGRANAHRGATTRRGDAASAARAAPGGTSALISALAYASFLTLCEWARSLAFNGYTSLSLGYALVDTWFAGYLPVGGLYLASWTGLLASAALAVAWDGPRQAPRDQARRHLAGPSVPSSSPPSRPLTLLPALPVALLLVPLAAGGWALQRVDWIEPDGPALSYRLIQSNIAQADKFDPARVRRHAARLVEQIEAAPADLIVTAETAFPIGFNELPASTALRLQQFSRRSASHVFVGIATAGAGADVYNSIVHFTPQATLARYDKVRLMPFGEYGPAGFGWFTGAWAIPLKDLNAGPESQPPFVVAAHGHVQRVGTLICHEDLIGRDARARAATSALLINPSNLAWFDGSVAAEQRLQIARVRALEVGRPLLRATNTGITAQIEPGGRIAARLPAGQDGVLSASVQPMRGTTPYLLAGDALPLALCLLGLMPAGATLAAARGRQPSGETPISQT